MSTRRPRTPTRSPAGRWPNWLPRYGFRQLALAADADTDTLLDEAARFTD